MLNPEDHAAWTDAFEESQRALKKSASGEPGWYGTVCAIAAALLTLWVLYTKLPIS